MKRTSALLSLTLAVATSSCGGGGSSSSAATVPSTISTASTGLPALPAIPEVVSQNGVAALALTAKLDGDGRPQLYFQGNAVAPTIRVRPGESIQLHYDNQLPITCGLGLETDSNLHFHGMASAPQIPGDEVLQTKATPGASKDYTVTINPDQPPGLYWYHTHVHQLASWQVGNGMAGAIVVEGIANEVPATAGMRERVIVLRDEPLDPTLQSVARHTLGRKRLLAARRTSQDIRSTPCQTESDARPLINGVPMALIGIRPGEKQLFRVLNASAHRHFDLSIDGQSVALVAQDGVPIGEYPGAPSTISVQDVVIPPASRAEFVVTGGTKPAALISKCFDAGPTGDQNPQAVLGLIGDDGGTQPSGRVRAPQAVRRTSFFRQALPAATTQREIHFEEDADGFYINGVAFAMDQPSAMTVRSGTVEEWTVVNDTDEVHVFHIHQIHFIVEEVNGVSQPNRHWADNVDVPPQGYGVRGSVHPGSIKVLMDFRDPIIRGTFLYHCHILDHEDNGMMAKITVI
ncbi:MAG TPA: multicopper oxidase family protein [Candidatus Elarobacter sp.]|jgi:FtsP/CotA-like multicopper oxidase with cupredoxin domain